MKTHPLFLFILLVSALSGCASVISKEALMNVDRLVSVPMVQADPNLYLGRKVIWGGVIVSTKNLKERTIIEVLSRRLVTSDEPGFESLPGRFLVSTKGFLDPLVYKPKVEITVVGTVAGIKTLPVGQMPYPYAILNPVEIKIFSGLDYRAVSYYNPRWWDFPSYGYAPYFDPLYGPYMPGGYPYYYYP